MLFEVADAAAAPLTAPREIACVRQAPRWDLRVARAMQTRPTRDTVVGNGDGGKQQTPWPQHEPLPFTTSSRGVYVPHPFRPNTHAVALPVTAETALLIQSALTTGPCISAYV
jgi:hypothetical protein